MPNLQPINYLKPFTRFCCSIGQLPTSYMVSLTYEEQLLWLCNYLEKTVIPTINNNAEAVTELQNLYVQLKEYVDNYFTNLDVQTEINNKLDEMAEDGTLQTILLNYLNINKVYNTFQDVIQDVSHLYNNQKIKTNGFWTLNDTGSAYYIISNIQNNNILQIKLNDTLYANLVIDTNPINILKMGATPNLNTFDNTPIINNILNKGYQALIPENNFYCKNTIYVNIENSGIIGISSNSKLIAMPDFEGSTLILIFTENGDYYSRNKRLKNIGNFTLEGITSINAITIGGSNGSSQEGHVDCVNYKNIFITNFNSALYLNSHVYKSIFTNIITDKCNYALFTPTTQTDQNEATVMLNCGFFSGAIYSKMNINFIGCTLHFNHQQTTSNNITCYAYFNNCMCNFTDCHFEDINRNPTTSVLENVFVASESILTFNNPYMLITGTSQKINDSFFKTIVSSSITEGLIAKIIITNGNLKYLLARINKNNDNFTLCKGNIYISSFTRAIADAISSISYNIYDKTQDFYKGNNTVNSVIGYGSYAGATINFENNVVTITNPPSQTANTFGIFKKYNVNGHKAGIIHLDVETTNNSIRFTKRFKNPNEISSILFFDKEGNGINTDNAELYQNYANHIVANDYFSIPENCEYILFGFGGYGSNYQYPISFTINKAQLELI